MKAPFAAPREYPSFAKRRRQTLAHQGERSFRPDPSRYFRNALRRSWTFAFICPNVVEMGLRTARIGTRFALRSIQTHRSSGNGGNWRNIQMFKGSSSKALSNFATRELLSITQAKFLCKRLFRVLLKSFLRTTEPLQNWIETPQFSAPLSREKNSIPQKNNSQSLLQGKVRDPGRA